ncbi:Ark- serine/threonine protein kinase [Sorochytrium milnesiophthora]
MMSIGGLAHVYLAHLPDGQLVVLKRIQTKDPVSFANFQREVEFMKILSGHRNVVSYIDASVMAGQILILMEYCPGGHVVDLMNRRLKDRLQEHEILKIFGDACEGVARMHYMEPAIIHRDLKVENLLLATSGDFKLCDFGSATTSVVPPRRSGHTLSAADIEVLDLDIMKHTTLQYRAPELCDLWSGKGINEKIDIWALGVMLYKLCFYTTPFEEGGVMAILNRRYVIPKEPAFRPELLKLIDWCLQEEPDARPNIYQVIACVCTLRGVPCTIPNKYGSSPAQMAQQQPRPVRMPVANGGAPVAVPRPSVLPMSMPADASGQPAMRRGRPPKASPEVAPVQTAAAPPQIAMLPGQRSPGASLALSGSGSNAGYFTVQPPSPNPVTLAMAAPASASTAQAFDMFSDGFGASPQPPPVPTSRPRSNSSSNNLMVALALQSADAVQRSAGPTAPPQFVQAYEAAAAGSVGRSPVPDQRGTGSPGVLTPTDMRSRTNSSNTREVNLLDLDGGQPMSPVSRTDSRTLVGNINTNGSTSNVAALASAYNAAAMPTATMNTGLSSSSSRSPMLPAPLTPTTSSMSFIATQQQSTASLQGLSGMQQQRLTSDSNLGSSDQVWLCVLTGEQPVTWLFDALKRLPYQGDPAISLKLLYLVHRVKFYGPPAALRDLRNRTDIVQAIRQSWISQTSATCAPLIVQYADLLLDVLKLHESCPVLEGCWSNSVAVRNYDDSYVSGDFVQALSKLLLDADQWVPIIDDYEQGSPLRLTSRGDIRFWVLTALLEEYYGAFLLLLFILAKLKENKIQDVRVSVCLRSRNTIAKKLVQLSEAVESAIATAAASSYQIGWRTLASLNFDHDISVFPPLPTAPRTLRRLQRRGVQLHGPATQWNLGVPLPSILEGFRAFGSVIPGASTDADEDGDSGI